MANGGGGGGGCYSTVRSLPEDKDIRIVACDIDVYLGTDGWANYSFHYDIEGTYLCKSHRTFWFYVPNPRNEIAEFKARDDQGGLETTDSEIESGDGKKTKFIIRYRNEMTSGARTKVIFSFRAPANVIVARELFKTIIFYVDYVSYTVECADLKYRIHPPAGFALHRSRFSHVSLVSDPGGNSNPHVAPILLHFTNVSPKSAIPIQVTIAGGVLLSKQFWKGVIMLLLSAVAGAVANALLNLGNLWIASMPLVLILLAFIGFMRAK